MIKYYKKKLQDVNGTLSKIQGYFYIWISWGIYIYSSCSSLDFLVFYIESKQEISFIYYLQHIFKELNGTCNFLNFFSSCCDSKTRGLKDKSSEINMEPSVMCVCVCVYVCLSVIKPVLCWQNIDQCSVVW